MSERQPHEQDGTAMSRFCGAKTRSGGTCRQRAMDGSRRCYLHGGKTPGGIASPNFRHGRYSRHLPPTYRAAYEQAVNDPELLNMSDALAVLISRHHDLLRQLKGGATSRDLKAAWRAFQRALDRRDSRAMVAAADRLESLIERAAGESATWDEIRSVQRDMAALARQEQQRREAMQAMVPVSQVMNFARDVLLCVRQNVTDPASWARVQAGVTELVGRDQALANAVAAEDAQC